MGVIRIVALRINNHRTESKKKKKNEKKNSKRKRAEAAPLKEGRVFLFIFGGQKKIKKRKIKKNRREHPKKRRTCHLAGNVELRVLRAGRVSP